ncbi:MAG: hypothetical protein ACRCSV_03115 [Chlamydiales bacterium]
MTIQSVSKFDCSQIIKYPYYSHNIIRSINSYEVQRNKITNENTIKFSQIVENPYLYYNISKYLTPHEINNFSLATKSAEVTNLYLKEFSQIIIKI